MFKTLLLGLSGGKTEKEMEEELANLRRQLGVLSQKASEQSRRADTAEGKLNVMASEVVEMTRELRIFTNMITRLSVMTESRNHAFILRGEIDGKFGALEKTREYGKNLLRCAGRGEAWSLLLEEATPVLNDSSLRYWLASALLAYAAWHADDRQEAEIRIRDAVLHDDASASLFFCLVMAQNNRDSAYAWLKRYFAAQTPDAMRPEAAEVFIAAWEGALGPGCLRAARETAECWVDASRPETDAVETIARWDAILDVAAAPETDAYPNLQAHSPSWERIATELQWANAQERIASLYGSFQKTEEAASPAPALAPDPARLLEYLLKEHHDSERAMRKEYAISQLLLDEGGDFEAAAERVKLEFPASRAATCFFDLLAEVVGGTRPVSARTRRMAVSLSRLRLKAAADRVRDGFDLRPIEGIELKIDGWSGTIVRGDNESDLLASFSRHWEEMGGVVFRPLWKDERILIAGGAVVLASVITRAIVIIPLLAFGGFAYYCYSRFKGREMERERYALAAEQKRTNSMKSISVCVAEVAALQRFQAARNRDYEEAEQALLAFSPSYAEGEAQIPPAAESTLLPDWELIPPGIGVKP